MLWLGHIVSVNSIFVDTENLHRLTLQQKEEKREKKNVFVGMTGNYRLDDDRTHYRK